MAAANTTSASSFISLPVQGMACASCVGRVERTLKKLPSVQDASVNLATEQARIHFTAAPDVPAAMAAIEKAGYSVQQQTVELQVQEMTMDAAKGYMTALAGTSGNVTQLLPSVTDSQSRLISAASNYYQSRIAAQELRLKASMPNSEWRQQANIRNQEAQTAAANAKVQSAIEAAKALSQQAAALLNALHVSSNTGASGSHNVSYSYSGEVSDDVPPHTV